MWPTAPTLAAYLTVCALCTGLLILVQRRSTIGPDYKSGLLWLCIAGLLFFGYAGVWTKYLATEQPIVQKIENAKWVTGRIREMQTYDNRTRVVLDDVTVYGPNAPELRRLRISFAASRGHKIGLSVGQGLAAQVVWQPPRAPAFPGDYDGRRPLFFQKIDAVGYVRGEMYKTALKTAIPFKNMLDSFRQNLSVQIDEHTRPLGAALLTGIRDNLAEETRQNFRESGLAHLLAISGLHVGMVAGLVYFGLRWFLALSMPASHYLPARGIGAVGGLMAAAAYALLAGGTIPTIRAFIMVALVFLAVLFARPHTALRLWAIAVLLILMLWPERIVSPSFQMSFAAALGLIIWSMRQAEDAFMPNHLRKRNGYVSGLWHAGLIAGLSTMPFAAWHFGMVSLSGFFLNLLAIPLMGFWVLPAGLLGLLGMPLGAEAVPFGVMDYGLLGLEQLAAVGGRQGGLGQLLGGLYISSDAWLWLTAITIVGLWALFVNRKYVLLGSLCGIGMLTYLFPHSAPGEVIVLDEGRNILLCQADQCGVYTAHGQSDRAASWFLDILELEKKPLDVKCDGLLCVAQIKDKRVLLSRHPLPQEDKRMADIILPTVLKDTQILTKGQWVTYVPPYHRTWYKKPN